VSIGIEQIQVELFPEEQRQEEEQDLDLYVELGAFIAEQQIVLSPLPDAANEKKNETTIVLPTFQRQQDSDDPLQESTCTWSFANEGGFESQSCTWT